MKLRGQRLAAAVVVVSLVLICAALAHLRTTTIESAERLTDSISQVVGEQTTRTMQTIDIRLTIATHELQELRAAGTLNEDTARAALRQQIKDLPFVRAFWVVDRDGRIAYDSDVGNIGLSLADRPYVHWHLQHPDGVVHIGPPVRSRSTGDWLVSVSRPMPKEAGSFAGIIVAAFEPRLFEKTWHSIDLGADSAVALLHRDGRMLVRSPPDEATMDRDLSRFPLFAEQLAARTRGVFLSESPVDKGVRITAYRVLPAYPELLVAVGSSYAGVLASWRRFAALTIFVWALSVIAALALYTLLQRQVDQLRRVQDQLSAQAGMLSMAGGLARLGGWSIDVAKERITWTDEAAAILDMPPGSTPPLEEVLRMLKPSSMESTVQAVRACIEHGTPFDVEVELATATGRTVWVRSIGRAVRDEQGNVMGVEGAQQDITQRVQLVAEIRELNASLEEKVAQRTRELARANEQMRAFSYSVSHDLRSPLERIAAFAQLLEAEVGGEAADRAMHYIARIRANAQEMSQLIDALLSLAHVAELDMTRAPVNLSSLATEVLERLAATQQQRAVNWSVAPGLVVMGDVRLMRSVMENLIGNAWKFTSNTAHAEIEVGGSQESGEYWVRDNGAGFDMAHAGRLFETFHRLHRSDEFPGTGIGLATVARAINRQGGSIWAQAEPGKGATFYFTMPQPPGQSH
jgi:signal transduction histidine kinase